MIWYRHWLEVRGRLLGMALAAILLGGLPGERWALLDGITTVLVGSSAGRLVADSDRLAWATFLARAVLIIFGPAIVFAGNGFRTWYMDQIGPSFVNLPYTLTLPVSRVRLVATRLAAGWLVMLVIAALMLGARFVAVALTGRDVPLAPMAVSMAWLCVAASCWLVVLGAVMMERGGLRMFAGLMAAICVCMLMTVHIIGAPASRRGSVAAFAVLALLSFLFTVRRARTMEF